MDSCVTAALAARNCETYALHFSYGQRTEAREWQASKEVAEALGIKQIKHLKIELFRQIGGSALTDPSIAVPQAPKEEASIGASIPVTYVPFRNAHFLSAAVSWAEVLDAKRIYIGAVEQDSSGYPDCRPAYYEAFQQLIRTGTREGDIEVVTPLIHMRKKEIIAAGLELDAPLHLTWSCYSGEEAACGVCESCTLRLRAFAEVGIADPIRYTTSSRS
jgi:7-cyano-7-deazaguanine synthase